MRVERSDAREAEGAPLLREYRVKSSIEGSNPSHSASSKIPRSDAPAALPERSKREGFEPDSGSTGWQSQPARRSRPEGKAPQVPQQSLSLRQFENPAVRCAGGASGTPGTSAPPRVPALPCAAGCEAGAPTAWLVAIADSRRSTSMLKGARRQGHGRSSPAPAPPVPRLNGAWYEASAGGVPGPDPERMRGRGRPRAMTIPGQQQTKGAVT